MKGRIMAILITTLFMSSALVGATTVTKDDGGSAGITIMGNYHKINLYSPWDDNDNFAQELVGDVVATASSTNDYGNAQSICEIGWWGTEEGEAGFDHWFEWVSPVTTDSASISIYYYYTAEVHMSSNWAAGDTAKAKLWFRFFVDDITSADRVIIDWEVSGGIGHDWTCDGAFVSEGIQTPLQKGKTYKIGVEVYAYSYATMSLGSYILSYVGVTHNQDAESYAIISWEDRPPTKPETPSGPTRVNLWRHLSDGVTCTYTTSTTDPDMEQVYYQWCFDDTGSTEWFGPYTQGQTVSVQHTWKSIRDDYGVKVKAKGSLPCASESVYSEPLHVDVVWERSKEASNPILLRILERFPLLQQFLQNFR